MGTSQNRDHDLGILIYPGNVHGPYIKRIYSIARSSIKMIFLVLKFFGFAATLTAGVTVAERNELLWAKLRNYQNVTGISDEAVISVWHKSEDIRAGRNRGYLK